MGWQAGSGVVGTEKAVNPILGPEIKGLSISPLIGRWLHAGSSNMAVLEVPLLSGFRVDVESLEQVRWHRWEGAGWGLWLMALTRLPIPSPSQNEFLFLFLFFALLGQVGALGLATCGGAGEEGWRLS